MVDSPTHFRSVSSIFWICSWYSWLWWPHGLGVTCARHQSLSEFPHEAERSSSFSSPGLVNVSRKAWKITMLLLRKLTISTGPWHHHFSQCDFWRHGFPRSPPIITDLDAARKQHCRHVLQLRQRHPEPWPACKNGGSHYSCGPK